ncbi:Rossmann-like and DUF2520 domain-containing protein [Enterococcus sp. AZ109]|uniref:Rossmann-like and DUF2520 domain-containing protein n=1 Tax=Enterococcus sp. AZ109 TaxID=2774634 RepID=UPI003F20ED4B
MKIGFVGAGKVGCSLGHYFVSKGFELAGFYSRKLEAATFAAERTGSQAFSTLEELVAASDWLFLTVSDGQILPVFQQVQPFLRSEMVVFHCSGVESSCLLAIDPDRMYGLYSFHPILAFPNRQTALNVIEQALFTLEGDKVTFAEVYQQLERLGNLIQPLEAEQKIRYHAACVMCSNLVNGLVYTSQELFQQAGFTKETAENAWRNLFIANAQNIIATDDIAALTGPIERGDLLTVEKHLTQLTGEQASIYRNLSQILVKMAQIKHPETDYTQLKEQLD